MCEGKLRISVIWPFLFDTNVFRVPLGVLLVYFHMLDAFLLSTEQV